MYYRCGDITSGFSGRAVELGRLASPADIDEFVWQSATPPKHFDRTHLLQSPLSVMVPREGYQAAWSCRPLHPPLFISSCPDYRNIPVTMTRCSSSGDQAAALIPLSILPMTSIFLSAETTTSAGQLTGVGPPSGPSSWTVAMSPPYSKITRLRSSGK